MSAPNFSCRNNSQYIFAFCEHSDFEKYIDENREALDLETEEDVESAKYDDTYLYEDWYNDSKECYLSSLEHVLDEEVSKYPGVYSDFTELNSNRIYDGDEVATVRKYIQFAGAEFMVMASIDFEAGYYEGFALDWNVKKIEGVTGSYNSSFDFQPDEHDCRYLLEDCTDLNAGLCVALAAKLEARLKQAINDVTDIIEDALKQVAPYHLSGMVASNGEGFYTNHRAS